MKKNSIKILALAALALSLGACGSGGKDGSSSEATSSSATSGQSTTTQESSSEQTSSQAESSQAESSQEQSSEGESSGELPSSEELSSEELSSEELSSEEESSEESSSEELTPTVYGIAEILSLDADNQWEHLGEKVIVEHLCLQGIYGNTVIGGAALGQTIDTLRGLEINCTDEGKPVFTLGSGWGADLTVEGILADVNGRAVINDAIVTVNSERNPQTGEGGLPVYGVPAQYMNRAFFNDLGRKMSGVYGTGVYQIASLPETITAEQGTDFFVTFPGENPDVEDEDNYSIINVHVPAGLSERAVTAFNEYYATKTVGSFILFDGTLQYDAIENFGIGLLVDNFAAIYTEDPAPEQIPDIFLTWDELAADAGKHFNDEISPLGDDRVFSYTYSFDGAATDAIKEEYVFLTDKENANCVTINYNYKQADGEAVVEDFVAKLGTLGYEQKDQGLYTLTEDEVVTREIIISGATTEALSYYYMAAAPVVDPAIETFATVDELEAAYEAKVGAHFEGFETALILAEGGTEYVLDSTYETNNLDEYGDAIYDYTIKINGDAGFMGEGATTETYAAELLDSGFEPKLLKDYDMEGLYNPTTREFVVFAAVTLGEEEGEGDSLVIDVFVLDETAEAAYITDIPHEEFESFDDLKAAYCARVANFVDSFVSALVDVEGSNYFELDWTYETALVEKYQDTIYQYTINLGLPEGSELTADAYKALLEGNGFVAKRLADYTIDGLFNETTNEFIAGVKVTTDGYLVIDVMVLTDDMVTTYITDIPDLITLDVLKSTIETSLSNEITTITGAETTYTMSFADVFGEDTFAGYTMVYSSNGQYAQYYASYGLVTQQVFDATFAEGVVAADAINAFALALQEAGFVQATCALLSGATGLWNAETNEFIRIQNGQTFARITLLVFDAKSAGNFVQVATAE